MESTHGQIPLSADYAKLKQIIQQANPEIKWTENICTECDGMKCNGLVKHERLIRLADVLLAMYEKSDTSEGLNFPEESEGEFPALYIIGKVVHSWNLKDDNLDQQSDETKSFLINLLIK